MCAKPKVKVTVEGIEKVQSSLSKELKKIGKNSLKGMIESSILVRRSMEETTPKTPIDTGNLRASWFVVTNLGGVPEAGGDFKGKDSGELASNHSSVKASEKGDISGRKPMVSMGFTANYAAAVHENMEAEFKRPGAGPKWFEKALKRNKRKILQLIAKAAKIR